MATKLDPSEIVPFKELLLANSIQIDTAVQLLIEKGFFSMHFTKLKHVQAQYHEKYLDYLQYSLEGGKQ